MRRVKLIGKNCVSAITLISFSGCSERAASHDPGELESGAGLTHDHLMCMGTYESALQKAWRKGKAFVEQGTDEFEVADGEEKVSFVGYAPARNVAKGTRTYGVRGSISGVNLEGILRVSVYDGVIQTAEYYPGTLNLAPETIVFRLEGPPK
jgi:hypothetical protein